MEHSQGKVSSRDAAGRSWTGLFRVSGVLLILTAAVWFVVSRTASLLYAGGYPGDPASYLQLIAQHQQLAAATWSLWIVADFLLIAPTVALYIVLRQYNMTLALLGSLLAMFFNVYDVCVTELNSLTLVSLSHGYAAATSEASRAGFVAAATYGYYALPIQTVLSFAVGSLGYLLWCAAMAKSVFPRWLAIFGAIASLAGLLGSGSPILPSTPILGLLQYICVPLMALWFIVVGVRLFRLGRSLGPT